MKSVDRVILNTVFKFILFSITWIDKWRVDTKEEGKKYHMETSISNSFSFFIFIHQFRLWWNRENVAIIIGSAQFRFWNPLISQSSPDENLSWVTEWAFHLHTCMLETRWVTHRAIHTICHPLFQLLIASSLSTLLCYPMLILSMESPCGYGIFPKYNNLKLVVDFLYSLLLL